MIGIFRAEPIFSQATLDAFVAQADSLYITNVWVPPDPIPTGTVYYFSEDGNDTNDGLTTSTPKQTLAKAMSILPTLSGGDALLFAMGDTFYRTSKLSVSSSNGSIGNKIIISRYWKIGDEANTILPVFTTKVTAGLSFSDQGSNVWSAPISSFTGKRLLRDGVEQLGAWDDNHGQTAQYNFDNYPDTDFTISGGVLSYKSATDPSASTWTYTSTSDFLYFTSCSHIIFNGLGIEWSGDMLIEFLTSNNIEIQNCDIGKYSYRGLYFTDYSNSGNVNVYLHHNSFDTGWRVDYTSLDYVWSGGEVGLHNLVVLNGSSNNAIAEYNTFTDFGHVGLMFYGVDDDGAGGIKHTSPKTLYNTFSAPNSNYSRPMQISGATTNPEVGYNMYADCTVRSQFSGVGNNIHHNIAKNFTYPTIYGADIIHGSGQWLQESHGAVSSWIIENNLFYNFENTPISLNNANAGHTLQNNIFVDVGKSLSPSNQTPSSRGIGIWLMRWGTDNPIVCNWTIRNNMSYDSVAGLNFKTVATGNYTNGVLNMFSVAELNADTTHSWITSNNLEADPLFVDTVDFRLASGSPAIGTGLLPTATEDYDGVTISAPYNIGIYNTNS